MRYGIGDMVQAFKIKLSSSPGLELESLDPQVDVLTIEKSLPYYLDWQQACYMEQFFSIRFQKTCGFLKSLPRLR